MKKNMKPSLAKANRALARQWHPTKNAPLTPRDVLPNSNKKVWWMCRKGHSWEATINNRNKGNGCPYCSGRYATDDNNLQALKPDLAKEWHPTKNTTLTPQKVTIGSGKKAWWKCKRGHEWEAPISNRSKGIGCPYCSGRYATPDNNFRTVYPELAKQWHPTKNRPLTPKSVTPHSRTKVWWKCSKGHEWQAIISSRDRSGCPYCSGRRVARDNCLQTVSPKLAREWHPVKNAPLTPKDVTTSYSVKKVWWLCQKGHAWEEFIYERKKIGQGCPFCSGHRVCKDNCLQTVKPELAKQWHPTKNSKLTPEDVTPGSDTRVWWICDKGHEWESRIANRAKGNGCPYCAGRAAGEDNCLQTVNPKLAGEWHPSRNRPLTPKNVTAFSNKIVWWKCRKGHQWESVIALRSGRRSACPYCSRQRASKEYCLQSINPKLAREWHTTKNGSLTPNDVTPSSHKKIWWKCVKDHEWEAVVNSRNRYGVGCPYCSGQRATKETCIETLSPWLTIEWHPTKNGLLTPRDVAPFSKRQIWWKCKKGHEHAERVIDRYKRGGCPECTLRSRAPRLFETKEDRAGLSRR